MVHLVRAGETGGFLDKSLVMVADNFEAETKLRGKVKAALTYPIVVLIVALVGVAAMLIFIVPVFEKMFSDLGSSLPAPTQLLVDLSHAMPIVVPIVLVAAIAFAIWWGGRRTPSRCGGSSTRSSSGAGLRQAQQEDRAHAVHAQLRDDAGLRRADPPVPVDRRRQRQQHHLLARQRPGERPRGGHRRVDGHSDIFPDMLVQMVDRRVGVDRPDAREDGRLLRRRGRDHELAAHAMLEPLMIVFMGGWSAS
jgi:type IV pilus assembly protein PilC